MFSRAFRVISNAVSILKQTLPGKCQGSSTDLCSLRLHRCLALPWHLHASLGCRVQSITTRPHGRSLTALQQALQEEEPELPEHPLSSVTANHLPDAFHDDEQLAEIINPLRDMLQQEHVSFPALMSMLRCDAKQPLRCDIVRDTIQQLRSAFGKDMVNTMMVAAPLVMERQGQALLAHFEGLTAVLGCGSLARDITSRLPDILNHNPNVVGRRIDELCCILEVDKAQILRLVKKAPVLLKRQPARVAEVTHYLQAVSGKTPQWVYQVFMSWPVMATTNKELLTTRHQALQALLMASQEEMQRLCRSYTSLLGRDTTLVSHNLTTMAQHLQLPLDQVLAVALREPGLLSWNSATLISRMTVICQTLRLPPELRLSLLTFNKTLLTHHAHIPQRVDYLRKLLGLSEAELLPLLHAKLSVLRLPVTMMSTKLAVANSLALLHDSWSADQRAMTPQCTLRVLQTGSAVFWRAVFLAHTGQQGTCSFSRAINASQATFAQLFPDFNGWIDRYNQIVSAHHIPLVPRFPPGQHTTPAHYPAVLAGSCLGHEHAGKRQMFKQQKGIEAHLQQSAAAYEAYSSDWSGVLAQPSALLPPTTADMLSAWWGIDVVTARDFLEASGKQRSWQQWQERSSALQEFMQLVGALQPERAPHTTGSDTCSNQSKQQDAAADHILIGQSHHSISVPTVGVGGTQHRITATCQQQEQPQQQPSKRRRRQALQAPAAGQMAADQTMQQQQQHVADSRTQLLPAAQHALQHALASGEAAAVACVSVACHLAPFSHQLALLPPRPYAEVVRFALQHPELVSKKLFVQRCNALAALVADSEYLRQEMQQMGSDSLARCLEASPLSVKLVQYLVQTQQPSPWQFSPLDLLAQDWLTSKGSRKQLRSKFVAAYPGLTDWEKAIHEM